MERPDSGDIDSLESLVISEGWVILAKRVMDVVEQKRDELEYRACRIMNGPGGLEYCQGFLAACRMFLDMPANLRAEFQSQIGGK